MAILYAMQGLPGSGKSDKAKVLVREQPKTVRISKDSLRHMFFYIERPKETSPIPTTPENELFVEHIEFLLLHMLLSQETDVVVDDTNLDPRRVEMLRNIAEMGGHTFQLVQITKSIKECIENDLLRSPPAGEAVIRAYAARWCHLYSWFGNA